MFDIAIRSCLKPKHFNLTLHSNYFLLPDWIQNSLNLKMTSDVLLVHLHHATLSGFCERKCTSPKLPTKLQNQPKCLGNCTDFHEKLLQTSQISSANIWNEYERESQRDRLVFDPRVMWTLSMVQFLLYPCPPGNPRDKSGPSGPGVMNFPKRSSPGGRASRKSFERNTSPAWEQASFKLKH